MKSLVIFSRLKLNSLLFHTRPNLNLLSYIITERLFLVLLGFILCNIPDLYKVFVFFLSPCATAVHEDSFYLSMVYKTNTSRSEAEILFSDDRTSGPLSFTCFPVVAFHVDTEHRNPLPLHVVVVEINIRDGDVPGREVSRGAGGGCCLHGGIILQHHHGFLHLEQKEVREV